MLPAAEQPHASDAELGTEAAHGMACMEIWGGNVATEQAVSTPGIDAYVYSKPYAGSEGGGDIHYVSLCSAGKIARFAVADVAGHGAEVSELAIRLRGMMRRYINTPDQARFASELNAAFGGESQAGGGRFATALLATYWAPTDHLIICNAGHPRPLWYRASERRWTLMTEESGLRADHAGGWSDDIGIRNLPLGILDPTDYTQSAFPLAKGDLVLIYTDSLTEATAPTGEMLGETGLLNLCAELDATRPEGFIEALLERVKHFRAAADSDDDVTALLLHHNAADVPRYSLAARAGMVLRMLGLRG
ncbi:MAG: PP2C family protein-serine/threonine phosphatase [Phycisphaerales bacterium]